MLPCCRMKSTRHDTACRVVPFPASRLQPLACATVTRTDWCGWCALQLNSLGSDDEALLNTVDLRISYRTRSYSDGHPDITRAYAIDIHYRSHNQTFLVGINTEVTDQASGSFSVSVNGLIMANPILQPLLFDQIRIKQMTNFAIIVSTDYFRIEFDIDSRIYVRLDPRFEKKVASVWTLMVGYITSFLRPAYIFGPPQPILLITLADSLSKHPAIWCMKIRCSIGKML